MKIVKFWRVILIHIFTIFGIKVCTGWNVSKVTNGDNPNTFGTIKVIKNWSGFVISTVINFIKVGGFGIFPVRSTSRRS